MTHSFRHKASFGKRMEYWIIGKMLKDGLDVYIPMVDDDAIDAVVRREDGSFVSVQIKARSKDIVKGNAGLFAGMTHEVRKNYWFIFYSERMDLMWILSSEEFLKESNQNKTGENMGCRNIKFNSIQTHKSTGAVKEYCQPRFERYLAVDFARLKTK